MSSALPVPSFAGLITQWSAQPLAIAATVLLGAWYARAAARRPGWPVWRSLTFVLGLALLVYTTCGFAQAYLDSLFWVWTSQQLALLLLVPLALLAGGPLLLAPAPVQRLLRRPFVRVLSNPLIGPALVPLLSAVLFFGPLPGWCVGVTPVGWIEQLVVVLAGALIMLPLVGTNEPRTSLAVGLGLAIGSFELVLDAVPGIALRLHRSLSTTYFDHRLAHPWTPGAVHDQQIAGAVLWCVAELIDLPFLVLVFRQWLRADARDAAQVDAVLDAERIARGHQPAGDTATAPRGTDEPWWLTDPAMQQRLRRPQ